jgi:DNA-binding NarL/FixJ family response regulator
LALATTTADPVAPKLEGVTARGVISMIRSLIVDDSTRFLNAARRLLEQDGMAVGVATTIAGALEQVGRLHPDVVLADIDLAGESGFELVRRLHDDARDARTRVILISTHDHDDYVDLIEASHAVGFLSKSALSAGAIRELLERPAPDGDRCRGGSADG